MCRAASQSSRPEVLPSAAKRCDKPSGSQGEVAAGHGHQQLSTAHSCNLLATGLLLREAAVFKDLAEIDKSTTGFDEVKGKAKVRRLRKPFGTKKLMLQVLGEMIRINLYRETVCETEASCRACSDFLLSKRFAMEEDTIKI